MRKSLIGQTLGKRGSIGTKSLAKNLAPQTPRPERSRRQQQQQQASRFDFAEGDVGEEDDVGGRGFDYGGGSR